MDWFVKLKAARGLNKSAMATDTATPMIRYGEDSISGGEEESVDIKPIDTIINNEETSEVSSGPPPTELPPVPPAPVKQPVRPGRALTNLYNAPTNIPEKKEPLRNIYGGLPMPKPPKYLETEESFQSVHRAPGMRFIKSKWTSNEANIEQSDVRRNTVGEVLPRRSTSSSVHRAQLSGEESDSSTTSSTSSSGETEDEEVCSTSTVTARLPPKPLPKRLPKPLPKKPQPKEPRDDIRGRTQSAILIQRRSSRSNIERRTEVKIEIAERHRRSGNAGKNPTTRGLSRVNLLKPRAGPSGEPMMGDSDDWDGTEVDEEFRKKNRRPGPRLDRASSPNATRSSQSLRRGKTDGKISNRDFLSVTLLPKSTDDNQSSFQYSPNHRRVLDFSRGGSDAKAFLQHMWKIAKNRQYKGVVYRSTFLGREAYEWLNHRCSSVNSRDQATHFGQALLTRGYFTRIMGAPIFKEKAFYHLTSQRMTRETLLKNVNGSKFKRMLDKLCQAVKRKSFLVRGTWYHGCVEGSDVVNWLSGHVSSTSREQVIEIGQIILNQRIFRSIDNEHEFKDDKTLYQFSGEYAGKNLITSEGFKLFYRTWKPTKGQKLKAVALYVHGLGLHCCRVSGVAKTLAEYGIMVFGYDQVGFGFSGGRRTYAPRFDNFVNDVNDMVLPLIRQSQEASKLPLFIIGAQYGALLALSVAFRHRFIYLLKGIICISPLLELHGNKPEPILNKLKHLGALDSVINTQSPKHLCEEIPGLAEAICDSADLMAHPMLVFHDPKDNICDYEATKSFVDNIRSEDKTLVDIKGHGFEMRSNVVERIGEWISDRSQRAIPEEQS